MGGRRAVRAARPRVDRSRARARGAAVVRRGHQAVARTAEGVAGSVPRAPRRDAEPRSIMSDEGPTETVLRFCAAWTDLDVDAICDWFTDDAVYHNIPIDPVTGREVIKGMIQTFTTGVKSIEFRVRNHATNGNVVMTE